MKTFIAFFAVTYIGLIFGADLAIYYLAPQHPPSGVNAAAIWLSVTLVGFLFARRHKRTFTPKEYGTIVIMRFTPFILILGLLTGCIWPHTTERLGDVRGRVLDARTHAPISQAKVYLYVSPHHTTYTDTNGNFHVKAVHQFHLGYLPPEGQWPDNKDSGMGISHPDYMPYGMLPDSWRSNDLGNIFLTPKQ